MKLFIFLYIMSTTAKRYWKRATNNSDTMYQNYCMKSTKAVKVRNSM